MRKLSILAAILVLGGLVATAQADIIYQDTFVNAGTLNGSAVTTGTGTWTANTTLSKASGAAKSSASTKSGYSAWLPMTIEANHIYTLTCDFQMYSGAGYGNTGDWVAAGFAYATTVNTGAGYGFDDYGRAFAIEKGGDSTSNYFQLGRGWKNVSDTSSSLNYVTYDSATYGSDMVFHTVKVVLNATNAAHWTMACYLDGAATPYNTYDWVGAGSSQPSINRVGFSVSRSSAYADNFTVSSVVVPEPGTLALLAAGLVGLIAYAWRKR